MLKLDTPQDAIGAKKRRIAILKKMQERLKEIRYLVACETVVLDALLDGRIKP